MPQIARIETERLLLRGPAEGDVEAWAALLTDPDFRRYIPVRRSDDSAEERARRGLAALSRRWTAEPLHAMGWVISLRDGGQMIGLGGVDEGAEPGDGEIDYFLGKPFWGKGYGGEAARAMARFAMDHVDLRRLVAYIVPGNDASIRIAEGLGMSYQGDVDYLQFFPDPSAVELSDPMTRFYAVNRKDFVPGDAPYRVLPPETA
jgi:ribosomal-protein-alanine N-acetyltransferase